MVVPPRCRCFFFFNDAATTEIYTLSLHDALPISSSSRLRARGAAWSRWMRRKSRPSCRSEEHTSELQSRFDLVCRLLLEKKKNTGVKYTAQSACFYRLRSRLTCFGDGIAIGPPLY